MTDIFKKAFYLLKLLARENNRVQYHIMERLDILLDVRVVESDLAIALKEVMEPIVHMERICTMACSLKTV